MLFVSNNIVYLQSKTKEMIDKQSINNKNTTTMNTAISTTCKVMSNIAIVNTMTATRASVIAARTNSINNGIVKAAMINELKVKLANGIAHFIYCKKSTGELREAWGTTMGNIAKAKTNGRGESRENYATTAYFDVEKGEWRSFRWETIITVF